ncbi:MAG: Mu-like prophage major head subunit gpT family protein [Syntrophobacteraceae bacterium]
MSKRTASSLNYRKFVAVNASRGPTTINSEARTVEVVAATENPVMVFDSARWEVVPEVLLMTGCRIPKSGQIPMLDAHSRFSASDVLGSARSLRVEKGSLVAMAAFADTVRALDAFRLIEQGHLTDFSIGYRTIKSVWVPKDQKQKFGSRTFEGPLKVTTEWAVKELSITPIGADEQAKARSVAQEKSRMENDLIQPGVSSTQLSLDEARAEAIRVERVRGQEIRAMCQKFNCDDLADGLITEGRTIEEARGLVLGRVERSFEGGRGFRPTSVDHFGTVQAGRTADEKRLEGQMSGLLIRHGISTDDQQGNIYAGMTLREHAVEILRACGVETRRLGERDLFTRAMVNADFKYLLSGSADKALVTGWTEEESSYELWTRVSQFTNFKVQNRIRLSELSSLEEVPEGTKYPHGELLDKAETFYPATYGKIFSFTRQAIINDDLNGFFQALSEWGRLGKRKLNQLVYSILTTNGAMADGIPLFDNAHSNIGTGGPISVTTVGEARKLMRRQKGIAGLATLNIRPANLIVPASLETVADQLLNTIQISNAAGDVLMNPFYNKLTPVIEPLLDDADLTDWFLAADPKSVGTIEVSGLNGPPVPTIVEREGFDVDGMEYKVRLDAGVCLLDYKGLVKNEGE